MILKTHKFLLAENPVNNEKFEQYIYSTSKLNRALIQISPVEIADVIETPEQEPIHTVFFTSKSTGLPEFYQLLILDNIDIPETEISNILTEAGKWYKHFLIWEEKEMFEGNPEKPLLKDYNEKVKGLIVIVSQSLNQWVFIFRGRIKVFSSDKDGFLWLSTDFNIDSTDLSDGFVNILEEIEEIIMERLEDL